MATLDPEIVKDVFNNNTECLFNHITIENNILFFTVQERRLTLRSFNITGDERSQLGDENKTRELFWYDVKDRDFQERFAHSAIKTQLELVGAVFIKGVEDNSKNSLTKHMYYALIFANKQGHLLYDIRHTNQPDVSLSRNVQVFNKEDSKLSNVQPVLMKVPAQTVFYQMMVSEKITNEDYTRIMNKIIDLKNLKKLDDEKHKSNVKDSGSSSPFKGVEKSTTGLQRSNTLRKQR